jgi:single-strand DNA-binding protein
MASVNKVILIGNIGQEIEFKTLANGSSVAKFSLATLGKTLVALSRK